MKGIEIASAHFFLSFSINAIQLRISDFCVCNLLQYSKIIIILNIREAFVLDDVKLQQKFLKTDHLCLILILIFSKQYTVACQTGPLISQYLTISIIIAPF